MLRILGTRGDDDEFRTIMVTDANAAMTDEDHNLSLRVFYLSFGDILSTDDIVAHLERMC